MKYYCSDCGRLATFITSTNHCRRGRLDHDLCFRCFKKLRAKVRAEKAETNDSRGIDADEPVGCISLCRTGLSDGE